MMIRKILGFFMALGMFAGVVGHAYSAEQASMTPEQTIETAVQSLLDEFVARRSELEQDESKLFDLVDEGSDELFDFERISKLILGKSWQDATPEQRQAFSDEFKRSLIVTYSRALFQYTGEEKMEFSGSEIKERKGEQFANVDSLVRLAEGDPVPVKYSMQLIDGKWKIYNITVQTLNMVLNFRKAISQQVSKDGLDATIASLRDNNEKLFVE